MKKFTILLILVLLVPIKSFSQTFSDSFKNEVVYINWLQQYPTVNCQASFYLAVTRTNIYNNIGEELYKIYFYSNSRYCNGSWAGTYLGGINIYINGMLYNRDGKYWVMFREVHYNPMFSFWSHPNPDVYLTWDVIKIN
jgi:hypothetical protein